MLALGIVAVSLIMLVIFIWPISEGMSGLQITITALIVPLINAVLAMFGHAPMALGIISIVLLGFSTLFCLVMGIGMALEEDGRLVLLFLGTVMALTVAIVHAAIAL